MQRHLDRLVDRVERQTFTRAADTMADALSERVRSRMGGDLTFSGGAGTIVVRGEARRGRVAVNVGGAYALADRGRRSAPTIVKPRAGKTLRTPWGPRASVRGSTWSGFGLTSSYGREALQTGARAVVSDVRWGRR